jgi:hypothetical protein
VNIDVGDLRIGVFDRSIELGYDSSLVNAANFGGKPIEPAACMTTATPLVVLPTVERSSGRISRRRWRAGRLQLESKGDMRKHSMPSPDKGESKSHSGSTTSTRRAA